MIKYIVLLILASLAPILVTWGKPHLLPAVVAGMILGTGTTVMTITVWLHYKLEKALEETTGLKKGKEG